MPNLDCLHCAVEALIKERFKKATDKEIILRLCEVIGDCIMSTDRAKDRSRQYDFWSNTMLEIMREIESGEYKA